ncbi:MAG: YhdH/YhfP family quinone oxidoreductase [Desulfobulbaceae bacterium]|nr:YhdH/YhfP family quinone oxidoreductase [Desulfobulbaceae bacterium]
MTDFQALIVEEHDKQYVRRIGCRRLQDLPDGDLLVRVRYSSLNYKDALSASGNRGVTKRYPHTPGIDSAGTVVENRGGGSLRAGDPVIVSGFDLGMNTSGGFGQYIRVPEEWGVRLPASLTPKESMMYGTAGFTAAQCITAIVNYGVKPEDGDVLVSGATGGVGSIAVAILAKLGYRVVALTGKSEDAFLERIGAREILSRQTFASSPEKALLRERWAAVVDTVGGDYLATAIKSTRYGGIVTSCGNAASGDLPLTVYPFILRGIHLVGIDSANTTVAKRQELWQKLGGEWRLDFLEEICREVPLADLGSCIDLVLASRLTGRVVVNLG